jgi:penicillin-binding protein 2
MSFMTRKFPSPGLPAFVVAAFLLFTAAFNAQAAPSKKPSKKPARAAAAAKAPSKNSKKAVAAKKDSGRQKAVAAKSSRAEKRREAAKEARASKNERAGKRGKREERAEKNAARGGKDSRKMSRRERIAEARREAERRRREAAERARQIAIARAAAIARQRAADQALRDEAQANILKDETTGEDLEVRRAAVEALGDRAGTVVVMDPKSGRVYTVVNQDWAIRKGFKPCSTIKLVSGLAGLAEGVIDPVQTVNIGTGSFHLDLTDSLAFSNNGYFQRVGGQVGFEKVMDYARKLGLGQPTGINHPFESPGRLPVFKQGFAVNKMSSHGDDIEVTPVQLATMTSALANGGKLLVPHLPRTPQENVRFNREVKSDINVSQEHVRRLVPGMIGAVNYGTAKGAYDPLQTVAGKTGSCIGQGSWLGLFTSYAPVHDPQLVVSVVLRNSGARGKYAAAVAGNIYRRLHNRFGPRPGSAPAGLASDMLAPRPKIDPSRAAEVSDEEKGDEDAAGDAFVVSESAEGDSQDASRQSNVQKTARTIQRPVVTNPSPSAGPSSPATAAPSQNTGASRPRRVSEKPQE